MAVAGTAERPEEAVVDPGASEPPVLHVPWSPERPVPEDAAACRVDARIELADLIEEDGAEGRAPPTVA